MADRGRGRGGGGRGGGRGRGRGDGPPLRRGDQGDGGRGREGPPRGRGESPSRGDQGRGGRGREGPPRGRGESPSRGDQGERRRGGRDQASGRAESRGGFSRREGSRGGRGQPRGGTTSGLESGVYGNGSFVPVDSKINDLEDSLMHQKSTLTGAVSKLSLDQKFPIRPGYGTQGKQVILWANYYKFSVKPGVVPYRYNVTVKPEEKGRKLRQIFKLLLRDSRLNGCVTDFGSIIISPTKIDSLDIRLTYLDEGEDEPRPNTSPHTVRVDFTGALDVSGLLSYLGTLEVDSDFSEDRRYEITQGLNILMGHIPRSNATISTVQTNRHYPIVGPKKFDFDLGAGLTALRGYIRSARPATGRMLLNVQIKHAAFFRAGPLTELIDIFRRIYGPNTQELERFLKKIRVETTHMPPKKNGSPRIKTIIALSRNDDGTRGQGRQPKVLRHGAGPQDVQFWYEKGNRSTGPQTGYITVSDYFRSIWSKTPLPNYPVMNVGTKENPAYIPADFCNVLPGQVAVKKLSPEQTKNMIQFACRKPFINAKSITDDAPTVLGLKDPLLQSYGIDVDTSNLITVLGRVLNAPQLKYKNNPVNPRDGSWNMKNIKFMNSPSQVSMWTCLWIKRKDRPDQAQHLDPILKKFEEIMHVSGISLNTRIDGPVIEVVRGDRAYKVEGMDMSGDDLNEKTITDMIGKISEKRCELAFVLLPDNDTAIYNAVKKAGDITHGVHTVCAVYSKVVKALQKGFALDQYLANISLKVNSKLNGTNQALDIRKLGIIGAGKTMVVGIDVTHPSPGSTSDAPSISAVVASTSADLAQFPGVLGVQESRTEMVKGLTDMVQGRIKLWKQKNANTAPENIIVYRDGVSEGQYNLILEKELPAIRNACKGMFTPQQVKNGLPKISIIVVGKRHNTRFYPTREEDSDRSSNPKNGTVVDRGVTSMWDWDFYLQAHTCLQGTAKPAHYYVVLDEIFGKKSTLTAPHPYPNPADTLEDLTHNMCYLFARATKAVSICPPAYYADLACTRARCYLSRVFDPSGASTTSGGAAINSNEVMIHPKLRDTMFYL